jgi:hypothetical protein
MVDVIIAEKMSDEKRRSLIYQGAIIVFRRVPAIAVLCEMAETMAREATKIDDPPLAHRLYDSFIASRNSYYLLHWFLLRRP